MVNGMYVGVEYYYNLYRDDVIVLNTYGHVEILIGGCRHIPVPVNQTVIASPKELRITPCIYGILCRRYMR